ncbi:MAG TPA: hypothetical protein PLB91_01230 [Spirochaetales bacterium]|nr:hypothetical protein [Spirochaetales bacterium]HRY54299.1 hypothetical protein [Spirochaetia bacterium]
MNQLIEDKRTYVPFFNGNRDLPEGEQVVVTYRVPDIALRRKLKPRPSLKFSYDAEGRVTGGETEVSNDDQLMIAGMLLSIKHLSYENSKGVHQITNSKELYQGPLEYEGLITELAEVFSKELEKVADEKN